jgi:hypothetical protein
MRQKNQVMLNLGTGETGPRTHPTAFPPPIEAAKLAAGLKKPPARNKRYNRNN